MSIALTEANTREMTVASGTTLRQQFFSWLRWPFAIGIVVFLFLQGRDGFAQVSSHHFAWWWLAAAFGLRAGSFLVSLSRWFLLLRAQNESFRFAEIFRLGCLGNAMNFVVPGTVGGDVAKTMLASRANGRSVTIIAATVLLDRLIGILGITLLGVTAAAFVPIAWTVRELSVAISMFAMASTIGVAGLWLATQPSVLQWKIVLWLQSVRGIGGFVREVINGLKLFHSRPAFIWSALLMSVAGHCCNVTAFACCIWGMGLESRVPTIATLFVVFPVVEVVAAMLPLPGGVGAREGGVQYLFAAMRPEIGAVAGSAGLFAALGFSAVSILLAAVCGVIAACGVPSRWRASADLPLKCAALEHS